MDTDHDYDVEDVLDLTEDTARGLKTLNLFALMDTAEAYLIAQGYEPAEWPEFGTKEEDVADRLSVIHSVLLGRLHIEAKFSEAEERLEHLEKDTDGMQYAIDQLKNHRHAEKTGEPVRPF